MSNMEEYMRQYHARMAERMFDAYNREAGGKTWDGKPIPPWSEVGDRVRNNWLAAAIAATEFATAELNTLAEKAFG